MFKFNTEIDYDTDYYGIDADGFDKTKFNYLFLYYLYAIVCFHILYTGNPLKYQVLIIDDNEDIYELMNTLLSEENFTLNYAENGLKGLSILNSGFMPSLIIVDHNMEEMNGPSFILELEKKFETILMAVPTVLFTASDPDSIEPTKATEVVQKLGLKSIMGILNKYCPVYK